MESILFAQLKQVAEAITATFGRNCEVAVYDLSNLRKSLCHLSGNITGLRVGAPAAKQLVAALQNQGHDLQDIYNAKTATRKGRSLKSTTVFLRDQTDNPTAALRIHYDTTDLFNAMQALAPFLTAGEPANHVSNNPAAGLFPETLEGLFARAVLEIGKQPATMSTDEKIALIEILDGEGAFRLKGAVQQVALLTGVSKYTIYNYLKKIRNGTSIDQM